MNNETWAPVAQLDRASASGVEGHEFESRRVYHFKSMIISGLQNIDNSLIFLLCCRFIAG